ncbi:zinc finger protein Xfin-like [Anopheles cruzii]|uniref:zinc finger protein Xfin-like n=1 Tax=Anopheles cruzii TaxID=68878 RepID=UPI0022EC21C5|nr:zinc finger protein Xfin-like [Anopheles cruzii]
MSTNLSAPPTTAERNIPTKPLASRVESSDEFASLAFLTNVLKPWTSEPLRKTKEVCSQMLDLKCLLMLYKCMDTFCSFATNDRECMKEHIRQSALFESFVEDHLCPYCNKTCFSGAVVKHIESEHAMCNYQCKFCFFRAYDAYNIVLHHRYHHDHLATMELIQLKSNTSRSTPPKLMAEESVWMCFLCCYRSCNVCNVVEHMETEHKVNSIEISFTHPRKVWDEATIFLALPSGMSQTEKRERILQIIAKQGGTQPMTVPPLGDNIVVGRTKPDVPQNVIEKPNCGDLYSCGYCQYRGCTSKLQLSKHILRCEDSNDLVYPCAHCGKVLDRSRNFEQIFEHLFYHGERLYRCSRCSFVHYRRAEVAKHLETVHAGTVVVVRESSTTWSCNMCGERSPYRQAMMDHFYQTHLLPGERYMCTLCEKSYFDDKFFVSHFQQEHPGEKLLLMEMYKPVETVGGGSRSEPVAIVKDDASKQQRLKMTVDCHVKNLVSQPRSHGPLPTTETSIKDLKTKDHPESAPPCAKKDAEKCNERTVNAKGPQVGPYSELAEHVRAKHVNKPLMCIDYWNSFKCGLCTYLNGSGDEREFSEHFTQQHAACNTDFNPDYPLNDEFLSWALAFGALPDAPKKVDIARFMCHLCHVHSASETSLGEHMAQHLFSFVCPHCRIVFRELKVLYEHVITVHARNGLVVAQNFEFSKCYDQLLDFQAVFSNGLIMSKRHLMATSVSPSIEKLYTGIQRAYTRQRIALDEYKTTLQLPLFGREPETCEMFLKRQMFYPRPVLEWLDDVRNVTTVTACGGELSKRVAQNRGKGDSTLYHKRRRLSNGSSSSNEYDSD